MPPKQRYQNHSDDECNDRDNSTTLHGPTTNPDKLQQGLVGVPVKEPEFHDSKLGILSPQSSHHGEGQLNSKLLDFVSKQTENKKGNGNRPAMTINTFAGWGVLYAELDEWNARIAELDAEQDGTPEAKAKAAEALSG